MFKRIGSNGWWLLYYHVDLLLCAWFPVAQFKKPEPCLWAKYEYQQLDPHRPLEAFGSWAGNKREWPCAIRVIPVRRRSLVAA